MYELLYVNEEKINYKKSLFFGISKESAQLGIGKRVPSGKYLVLSYDIDYNGIIQTTGLPSTNSSVEVYGSNVSG